jgi:hypothetical protein
MYRSHVTETSGRAGPPPSAVVVRVMVRKKANSSDVPDSCHIEARPSLVRVRSTFGTTPLP